MKSIAINRCLLLCICLVCAAASIGCSGVHRDDLGVTLDGFLSSYNQIMENELYGYRLLKNTTFTEENGNTLFAYFPSDYLTVAGYHDGNNRLLALYIVNSNNSVNAPNDMQQHTMAVAAATVTLDNTVTSENFTGFSEKLFQDMATKNSSTLTQNGFVYSVSRDSDGNAFVTITPQGEKQPPVGELKLLWRRELIYPNLMMKPAELQTRFNQLFFEQKLSVTMSSPRLTNESGTEYFYTDIGTNVTIDGPIDEEGNILGLIVASDFDPNAEDRSVQELWQQCIVGVLALVQPDYTADEVRMLIARLPLPTEPGSVSTTYYSMRYSVVWQDEVYAFVVSPNNGNQTAQ